MTHLQPIEHYIHVGGVRVCYRDLGQGEPLLLLHGGGPGASGWSNYSRNAGHLAERFRVIVPDFPGFGASDKALPDEYLFTYLAEVTCRMMDGLGIERAHMVGNSLGGGTVLKLALTEPARLGRAILMGSGGSLPTFSAWPTEGVRRLVGYYQGDGPSLQKLRDFIDIMVYDGSAITNELLEQRYRASIDPDVISRPPITRREGKVLLEDLWREELGQLPHEFLLVWGREDRVVPLDSAFILLKLLQRARLHVFPQCGHWAQWEKADEFNALVTEFLTHRGKDAS